MATALRDYDHFVSRRQVEGWKAHAEAWRTRKPILFGEDPPVGADFIALDLEYLQGEGGLVWLIGGAVVTGRKRRPFSFWADSSAAEIRSMAQFRSVLRRYPRLPILTWGGKNADLPNLRHAGARSGDGATATAVARRHTDLFHYCDRNVRLPIRYFGLKEVAAYYDISRTSRIQDGMEAEARFREYCRVRSDKQRKSLRAELLQYNREDVDALIDVAARLRGLRRPQGTPSAPS